MENSQQHVNFRAAFALNNIGVTLLERHCYKQAIRTLRDAVLVMKMACRGEASGSLQPFDAVAGKNLGSIDVSLMMRRANLSLSNPRRVEGPSNGLYPVVGISDEADTDDMDAVLAVCPLKTTVVFPFRFDPTPGPEYYDKDVSLSCTTILLNFGFACLCRSRIVPEAGKKGLLENASKVFKLCQSVLATQSSNCSDHHHLRKVFFLGHVVVGSLIHTLQAAGRSTEANMYIPKLASLKAGVQELKITGILDCKRNLAPAA